MNLEINAVYENGVLRPDQQFPLANGQRVKLTVQPSGSAVERLYGMIQWKGSQQDLDYLLGPDNSSPTNQEWPLAPRA